MKKFIKLIIFILLFCFIWKSVFFVLWLPDNSINKFYDEPKNSLDVVYIGASNVYAHFNTVLAYKLYGFTTGMLTSSQQPLSATKYLLKEANIYQNPKVYVIDIGNVSIDVNTTTTSTIRNVTDAMKYSKNRSQTIDFMLQYVDEKIEKKDYYSFYYSFFIYHNSWKNINYGNFVSDYIFKGYYFTSDRVVSVPQKKEKWSYEETELPQDNLYLYLDLIKYIKSKNLNVIFVVPIRFFSNENMAMINSAIKIANDEGIKTINFNELEDFDIDFSHDFYNASHLNVYGAIKYTKYFSKYLDENYNLPNHKKEKKYNSWDKEYERFVDKFEELTKTTFSSVIKNI